MTILTKEDRDKICSDLLNQYIFSDIWNEVVSEYRCNIKPLLLKKESVIGVVDLMDTGMTLPDKDPYYIWMMDTEDVPMKLHVGSDEWTSSDSLMDNYSIFFHMFNSNGTMLHKKYVHLRANKTNHTLYIAVNKKMFTRVLTANELERMYATIYYDSDNDKNIYLKSFQYIPDGKSHALLYEMEMFLKKATSQDNITIYINGWERKYVGHIPVLNTGDYIDMIVDNNVVFSFDVNVTSLSEDPVYLSEFINKEGEEQSNWKQIVHIPKNLNPENNVYTFNTMDFYIRETYSDEPRGLLAPMLSKRESVSQITHNDVGLALFVIDSLRDKLDTNEVTIHVKVRRHKNDNKLIDEASYIKLLYQHDDDYIVSMLSGENEIKDVYWWKASELENSGYVRMLFEGQDINVNKNMQTYVDTLGFYKVIDLVCHRIQDTIVTDAYNHEYHYVVPLLYRHSKIIPLTYHNGRLIAKDLCSFSVHGDGTATVFIDKNYVILQGDSLVTIFYLDSDVLPMGYHYTPTLDRPSMSLDGMDYDVYTPVQSEYMIYGISSASRISYQKLVEGTDYSINPDNNNPGKYILYSSNWHLGNDLIVQPKNVVIHETISIDTTGENIVIPLVMGSESIDGTNDSFPLLNMNSIAVYLNGVYLIRDLDYTIVDTVDDSFRRTSVELVIQTMDHFSNSGDNKIEYLINMADIENTSGGYLISDTFTDKSPVNVFYENITTMHVNGLLERKAINHGKTITVPSGKYPNLSKVEVQTTLPELVKDFIEEYHSEVDNERIDILNKVFETEPIPLPEMIITSGKHRIYSIFMNKVIYEIVTGEIEMIDEPDILRMEEIIGKYEYLKQYDLVFNNKLVDPLFVDFYPQYVNYTVPSEMKRLIDSLILQHMPSNEIPTVNVVYNKHK